MNNISKSYREGLDRLRWTRSGKAALVRAVTAGERAKRPRRAAWGRPAMAAAVLCAFVMTAGAAGTVIPILREQYRDSPGYRQSSAILGQSQTKDGWTLTLTDCVGDNSSFYLGFELTAPEGTRLDPEEGYYFDTRSIRFQGTRMSGAWSVRPLEDPDPSDQTLYYRLDYEGSRMDGEAGILGRTAVVNLGRLYHHTQWNEARGRWDVDYDTEAEWTFRFPVEVPNRVISLEPNAAVTVLGVEAVLTELEVSPIGVYARMEGDALKGHHGWAPKAPDGGPWCWGQELWVYTRDGQAVSFQDGQAGSGCSGGTDSGEKGMVYVVYRFEEPLDLDTLERVVLCGAEILLN